MLKFIVTLLILTIGFSQSNMSNKEKLIREYFELSGKAGEMLQGLDQAMHTLKSMRKHVPDDFWESFKQILIKEDLTTTAELVKIYAKHFTVDEIEAINTFYKSPVGKKLGKLKQKLTLESMVAGREWGKKLGARLEEELKKKGF